LSQEDTSEKLRREALRLHRRYQREVVERFSICPWAKAARESNRIRSHVIMDVCGDARALKSIISDWAADEEVDVAFIVAPHFEAGAAPFEKWAEEIGALRRDVFVSAPFHPGAPPSAGPIRFLRQTPDPTVQLVRRARLEEIRSEDPPHYRDIFDLSLREIHAHRPAKTVAASVLAYNTRLVERHRKTLAALLADIRRDRLASAPVAGGDDSPGSTHRQAPRVDPVSDGPDPTREAEQ
jgi:hypothetical protein